MSSPWRHVICDDCWDRRYPTKPSPRYGQDDEQDCCFCGNPTRSGIYIREDPAGTPCGGEH